VRRGAGTLLCGERLRTGEGTGGAVVSV
jgi:hypothetical protein